MQIKKCIYILLAAFMPSTIQAMLVSQALVPIEQNNLLILGTYHSGNKDQGKKDAHRLVEVLQSLMHGAHIIVEKDEHDLKKLAASTDSFITGVAQRVSDLKKEGKTRSILIAGDERSTIYLDIAVSLQIIKQFYLDRQANAGVADSTIATDLHFLAECDNSVVLAEYYKQLEVDLEKMRAIQRSYMPKNPCVEQIIQDFLKAYAKIRRLLKHEEPDAKLGKSVIKLFYHCNTAEELYERLEEMSQYFVTETVGSLATLVFLKKMLDLGSSNKNIVMVFGEMHAKQLKSILENAGKKILYNKTIIAYLFNRIYVGSDQRAAAESAFLLAQQFVDMCNHISLAPEISQTHCVKCQATANLKRCSRCKKVSYCSIVCQSQDWPQHKNGCMALTP